MATAKHPTGFHSPTAKDLRLGEHNSVTKVPASTIIDFTGSRAVGNGFIPQTLTQVTCSLSDGSQLLGTGLSSGTYYPIGVDRVETGALGIVHVLHR